MQRDSVLELWDEAEVRSPAATPMAVRRMTIPPQKSGCRPAEGPVQAAWATENSLSRAHRLSLEGTVAAAKRAGDQTGSLGAVGNAGVK